MNPYTLPELPTEVIINEILSRTSPKTVSKSRTICKQLNEETHEASFAGNLHRRTNTVSGFFVQSLKNASYSSKFVPAFPPSKELSLSFLPLTNYLHITAAAKQGLLLCVGESRPRVYEFFVCKPATEEWVRIPRPKTRYLSRSYAMAVISSNPKDFKYKIARFSDPKNLLRWRNHKSIEQDSSFLRCEIFDSSKWAWRELPGPVRLRSHETLDPNSQGSMVSVSGVAYALTTEGRILALDWSAETWEVLSPAPLLSGSNEDFLARGHLMECCGRLGLVVDPELWVSENGRVWNLRIRVNLKEVCGGGSFARPLSMVCSDFGMAMDLDKMIFFRVLASKAEIAKVSESVFHSHLDCFFKIESDEECIDLRRPMKENID